MKQHFESVTKQLKLKEIPTKGGKFLYTFSVPITKMNGEEQLTEWLQVAILQDEQRNDLKGAKEVHFIGQIVLKEAYGDRPQGLSVFGFYIEPVLSDVYRQRKVKKNTSEQPEDAPEQPNEHKEVPQHRDGDYSDPVKAITQDEHLENVPF